MNIKTITVVAVLHLVPLAVVMAKSSQVKFEPVPEIPTPTPLPSTPIPVPSPLPKPSTATYTVKQGDTITKIVKKYKLNTKYLLEINHIKDPNSIKVGQILKFIP